MSVTPTESDVSSDDSGLVAEDMGMRVVKKPGVQIVSRRTVDSGSSMLINVIGHGEELRGNGLYMKPESSLYQCVMCDYTTKYIAQLSWHLEKHQAGSATTTTSNKNYIVTV